MTTSLETFFHTVRYLRPEQIYRRVYRPRPELPALLHAPRRQPVRNWAPPISRPSDQINANTFRFLNQERVIRTWNDKGVPKLWLYNLHYFDHVTPDLIERWILENPPGTGNGWEPYPLSIRIINWIKWALTSGDLSENALRSLQAQTEYLSQSIEYHLCGNHLLANAAALTMSGTFFDGSHADRWLQVGTELLDRELHEQVLPDGAHYERSPMYHAIVLETLLDLINAEHAYGSVPFSTLLSARDNASHMLGWLLKVLHPDGGIPFFNDATFGVASEPREISEYATRLGIQPADLPLGASGYVRLTAGDTFVLFDAGAVGPNHQPGHAHADTLSFELSHKGQRVLVNSGTSTYEQGPDRQWQRGTAAHNTVRIDHSDQSETWGSFRVGRRAFARDVCTDGKTFVEAAHDGYTRLPHPVTHRRRLQIGDREVSVTDYIEGRGRHTIELFFHFHPDAAPRILLDSKLASRITASHWHPQFNMSVPNTTLTGSWTGPCPVQFTTIVPL